MGSLREARGLSLRDLGTLVDSLGDGAGSITIGELIDGEASDAARTRGGRKPKQSRTTVETRTTAGRAKYDAKVLRTIKRSETPVGAETLRPQVGGSPEQLRRALHRLLEARKIRRQGRTRATVYITR